MTVYVVTPKQVKEWIDNLEKKGAKAFVISTEMHGNALAPTKRVNGYRIPLAIPAYVFSNENFSKVMGGSRLLLPVDDLSWLSEDSIKVLNKPEPDGGS